MGWVLTKRQDRWRGAGLMLALAALLLNILIPPGFMAAAGGRGPALVICSGHGSASIVASDLGKPLHSPKQKPDAPCVFAGHGLATTATTTTVLTTRTFVDVMVRVGILADLVPGRGLAAPPPPSQAPPLNR